MICSPLVTPTALPSLHRHYFQRGEITFKNETNLLALWLKQFPWMRKPPQRAQVAMVAHLEGRMDTARTSEDREDRDRQQDKGNRGKRVEDMHLRSFPTPPPSQLCRDTATGSVVQWRSHV